MSIEASEPKSSNARGRSFLIRNPLVIRENEEARDAQLADMKGALVKFRRIYHFEHHVLDLPRWRPTEKKKDDPVTLQHDILVSYARYLDDRVSRKEMTSTEIAVQAETRTEKFRSQALHIKDILHNFLEQHYREIPVERDATALSLTRVSIEQHTTQLANYRRLDETHTTLRKQYEQKVSQFDEVTKAVSDRDRYINDLQRQIDRQQSEWVQTENALQTRIKDLEQQQTRLNSEHQRRADKERQEASTKLQQVQSGHQRAMDSLKFDHQTELAKARSEFEVQQNVMQAALVSSSDLTKTLTDSDLKKEFNQLKSAVEDLARESFRSQSKPGPNVAVLGEVTGFPEAASAMPEKYRRQLLEHAIWQILLNSHLAGPMGLHAAGQIGEALAEMWFALFDSTKNRVTGQKTTEGSSTDSLPLPKPLSEQWRSLTVDALRTNSLKGAKAFERLNVQCTEQKGTKEATQQRITSLLRKIAVEPEEEEVSKLVENAAELALLFGTQKARVELYLPSTGDKFTPNYEEVVACNNDTTGMRGVGMLFAFGVTPGLRRWGNSRGGALETASVLLPARVYV